MHIRVVTPVIATGLTHASDFEGILGDGNRLSDVEIETGRESIECKFDAMLAAPETVVRIIEVESDETDTLINGCTAMAGMASAIQEELAGWGFSLPVLDPVPLTVSPARLLAESRLSHSEIACPAPGCKGIRGYDQFGQFLCKE